MSVHLSVQPGGAPAPGMVLGLLTPGKYLGLS